MRVCQVTPYELGRVSGISTVVLALAKGLAARGDFVAVVAPQPVPRQIPAGVVTWLMPVRRPMGNLFLACSAIELLWRHRAEWDLVHSHQAHPATVAATLVARILGRPTVTTLHLRPPPAKGIRGTLERIWIHLSIGLSLQCVFVSEHTRSEFAHRGDVVRNGVDIAGVRAALGNRAALRASLGLEGLIVAFAGRRAKIKGYGDLLDAVRRVRDGGVDIRLLVTGDVPPEESVEIEQPMEPSRPPQWFRDMGTREDHLRFLAAADVFALPSYLEGLPMSILEAMAAGLPIVGSNVGGIPEIVEDGKEGFLVPRGDVSALAERLRLLARDPRLRADLGARALKKVGAFDIAQVVTAYVRIYQRLSS